MSTFQVPQFIEQKSKVVGPLTLPQFLYLAGAVAVSALSFRVFTYFLWIIITIFLGAFALALAFIKIHGKDLIYVLFHALGYAWKPRVYAWRREEVKYYTIDTSGLEKIEAMRRKMNMQEKIKAITLFVTTKTSRTPHQIKGEQERARYQRVRYLTGEEEVAKRVDY